MHGDHNNIFDRTIGGTISLKKPKVMDESNYDNDLYKKYKLQDSYHAEDKTRHHSKRAAPQNSEKTYWDPVSVTQIKKKPYEEDSFQTFFKTDQDLDYK